MQKMPLTVHLQFQKQRQQCFCKIIFEQIFKIALWYAFISFSVFGMIRKSCPLMKADYKNLKIKEKGRIKVKTTFNFYIGTKIRNNPKRNLTYSFLKYKTIALQMYLLAIVITFLHIVPGQALINVAQDDDSSRANNVSDIQSSTPKVDTGGKNDFNKLDSMAAVLMKPAQNTVTTKRSTSEYIGHKLSSQTTVIPPLLTTIRYIEKTSHQEQINLHHRNYEFDLERDHALPTSAPNADILKSNSNPTYPNPNRHHNHERDRHRHIINSTPVTSHLPNSIKKNLNGQFLNVNDMPSYSPPARSFFTPRLPPEYQNAFADKPTLRGTNNEGLITLNNGGSPSYINRRPIPPPSLMPGHERIPLRPPESANPLNGNNSLIRDFDELHNNNSMDKLDKDTSDIKVITDINKEEINVNNSSGIESQKEFLPSIRRILSGSNGNKEDIPDVLLKHVTLRPITVSNHVPSSPEVVLNVSLHNDHASGASIASNINHQKTTSMETLSHKPYDTNSIVYPVHMGSMLANNEGDATVAAASATISSSSTTAGIDREHLFATSHTNNSKISGVSSSSSSSSSSANYSTWTIAWNVHVYLSVILFTMLAVYSFYKLLTYNKLTHLIPQSYFLCIHLVLISISTARVFYLCYDAYNIHSSFHLFISELLLNLPATLLTVSFVVLMLFLFRKSLYHKHNRYSALVRPLTIIVACGVHVVLCITLHYVESYTMQNYYQQQQQIFYQQQQQRFRQIHTQSNNNNYYYTMGAWHQNIGASTSSISGPMPPPRVLSLICQIIYIFICLSMGFLYLYLYRIIKRVLRSKSQNYIHGYHNLSYAIHITIATALLFILLAILQIFGAIGISAKRPLTTQSAAAVVEVDWLQWGYQFSLRLIEVAIITLISWVAGLKTKSNIEPSVGNIVNIPLSSGGQAVNHMSREKFGTQRHAGFFLPCTSSSSQEQFETDYPAICNANTNLHTYTMRTGKLTYEDFPLNTLGQTSSIPVTKHLTELHHSSSSYQHPYESNSLRSIRGGTKYNHRYGQNPHHQYATTDYLTDGTTDHYENPNFDLQCANNHSTNFTKPSSGTSTTTASSKSVCATSCAASGASSQQQMLLLQSESCYSEPNYDLNNFEHLQSAGQNHRMCAITSDNGENRSSNSCVSSSSSATNYTTYAVGERRSGRKYASYNSFDRGVRASSNAFRKSGTLNNIVKSNCISADVQRNTEVCFGTDGTNSDRNMSYDHPPTLERSNSRTPLQKRSYQYKSDFENERVTSNGASCTETKVGLM